MSRFPAQSDVSDPFLDAAMAALADGGADSAPDPFMDAAVAALSDGGHGAQISAPKLAQGANQGVIPAGFPGQAQTIPGPQGMGQAPATTIVGDIGYGLATGVGSAVQQMGGAMEATGNVIPGVIGRRLREAGADTTRMGMEDAAQFPQPTTMAGQIAQSVPGLAAAVGAGVVTGGMGGLAMGAGMAGAQSGGQQYNDAKARVRAAGGTEQQARDIATREAGPMALFSAATSAIPMGRYLQRFAPGVVDRAVGRLSGNMAFRLLGDAAAEGSQEAAEELASMTLQAIAEDDPEAFRDWGTRLATAGAGGAILGGGMGATLDVAGRIGGNRGVQDAQLPAPAPNAQRGDIEAAAPVEAGVPVGDAGAAGAVEQTQPGVSVPPTLNPLTMTEPEIVAMLEGLDPRASPNTPEVDQSFSASVTDTYRTPPPSSEGGSAIALSDQPPANTQSQTSETATDIQDIEVPPGRPLGLRSDALLQESLAAVDAAGQGTPTGTAEAREPSPDPTPLPPANDPLAAPAVEVAAQAEQGSKQPATYQEWQAEARRLGLSDKGTLGKVRGRVEAAQASRIPVVASTESPSPDTLTRPSEGTSQLSDAAMRVPPPVQESSPTVAPREAWQMTQREYVDAQITGRIPSSAYEDYATSEGISWIKKEKYVQGVGEMDAHGQRVELRMNTTPVQHVRKDAAGEIIRDSDGMATYLTDKEAKDKGLSTIDGGIAAFIGTRPVGFASNEFGTSGVWVVKDMQRAGIGARLLRELHKSNPQLAKKPIGQATIAGDALVRSHHKSLVREAVADGKPVPPPVLAEYPDLAAKVTPTSPAATPDAVVSGQEAQQEPPAAQPSKPQKGRRRSTDTPRPASPGVEKGNTSGDGSNPRVPGLRVSSGWGDALGRGEYAQEYVATNKSGKVIGRLRVHYLSNEKNTGYVNHVEVDPNFRRRGVATALYDHVRKAENITEFKMLGDVRTPDGSAFRKAYDARYQEAPIAASRSGSSQESTPRRSDGTSPPRHLESVDSYAQTDVRRTTDTTTQSTKPAATLGSEPQTVSYSEAAQGQTETGPGSRTSPNRSPDPRRRGAVLNPFEELASRLREAQAQGRKKAVPNARQMARIEARAARKAAAILERSERSSAKLAAQLEETKEVQRAYRDVLKESRRDLAVAREDILKLGEKMRAANDKAAIREEARGMVGQLAAHLPVRLRGVLITDVRDAKSMADIYRAVTKAQDAVAKDIGRRAEDVLDRYTSGKVQGKLSDEARKRLAEIERLADDARKRFRAPLASAGDAAVELAELADQARAVVVEYRAENKLIREGRYWDAEIARGKVIDALDKRAKLPPTDTGKGVKQPGLIRRAFRANMDAHTLAAVLDNHAPGEATRLIREIEKGNTRAFELKEAATTQADVAAQRAGYANLASLMAVTSGTLGDGPLVTQKVKLGGKDFTLTLGELAKLYSIEQDVSTRALIAAGKPIQFREGGKFSDPIRLSAQDFATVAEALPQEVKATIDAMKATRDRMFPAVQKVIRFLKGYEPPKEAGYEPRYVNREGQDTTDTDLRPDLSGMMDKHLENAGFTIERVADKKNPLIVGDFFHDWNKSISGQADVIALATPIANARKVLLAPAVKKAIAERFGDKAPERIRRILVDAAGMRADPGSLATVAQRLTRNVSYARTAMRPASWLIQGGGVFRLASEMPARAIAAGVRGAFAPGTGRAMMDGSARVRKRYSGSLASINSTLGDPSSAIAHDSDTTIQKALRAGKAVGQNVKAGDIGGVFNKALPELFETIRISNFFDSIPARVAWAGWQFEAMRQGKDQAWAVENFERTISAVLNWSDPLHLSGYSSYLRNTALVPLTAFKADATSAWNQVYRAYGESAEKGNKAALGLALSALWASVITGGAGYLGKLLVEGEDDETAEDEFLTRASIRFLQETLGVGFVGGELTDLATSGVRGFDVDVADAPMVGAMNQTLGSIARMGKAGMDAMGDDPEKAEAAGEKFLDALMRGAEGGAALTGNPLAPAIGTGRKLMQGPDGR